jgi:hypothetical protein
MSSYIRQGQKLQFMPPAVSTGADDVVIDVSDDADDWKHLNQHPAMQLLQISFVTVSRLTCDAGVSN